VHLPRRTAVTLCALALTGTLAGCSDNPVASEPKGDEPGGAQPGGSDRDGPDGAEVTPPSGP